MPFKIQLEEAFFEISIKIVLTFFFYTTLKNAEFKQLDALKH
jgi:hypothetical protein